jgi:zinc protease
MLSLPLHSDKIPILSLSKKGVSTHVIVIGFRTCSRFSKDRFLFKILKRALSGMSGRLFTILREKNGLTYSSGCITEYFEHMGYFMISTETSPEHTTKVITLLIQICMDLKKKGITEQEYLVAKGNIRGKYILNSELSDNYAAYNGKEYLLHPDLSLETFVNYGDLYSKNIEPIAKKDINQAIKTYFTIENMVIGVIGINPPTESKIREISKRFL